MVRIAPPGHLSFAVEGNGRTRRSGDTGEVGLLVGVVA